MTSLLQRWRNLSTLQVALLLSAGVHAALLTVRFVDPQRLDRLFADSALEVVLVNAKGSEAPVQAQALAQANLAGGGDLEQGRATSPLPPQHMAMLGDSIEDEQRRQEAMQQQQALMLAQLRQQIAMLAKTAATDTQSSQEHAAQEDRQRKLLHQLAEIDKRIQEQNARPRKRYISPATKEVPYAMYYDGMRRRIEDKGTENFPVGGGKKLYGSLIVSITVDRNGQVLDAHVDRSSGNPALDRQAVSIARASGPFGPFNQGMSRSEQLVVVSQFRFTREETLETALMRPQ